MEFDSQEEAEHFGDVVLSFAEYSADTEFEVRRRERAFRMLPASDTPKLTHIGSPRFAKVRECARQNQIFLDCVISPYIRNVQTRAQQKQTARQEQASANVADDAVLSNAAHMSKCRSVLHQICREWSVAGAQEREKSFDPILRLLNQFKPIPSSDEEKEPIRVCVPGCGLGRLAVEIAAQGYHAQGCEFSYQMILAGDFIMNRLQSINEMTIYPWIDQPSNVKRFQDHVSPVVFPDQPCVALLGNVSRNNLSICAGEFVEIYREDVETWDVIVFCFFLDTGPNLCDYLRACKRMLKKGGLLIHLGPLQWHFQPEHGGPSRAEADARFFSSIELTYEDVKMLVRSFGFQIIHEESVPGCRYAGNPNSMLKSVFDSEVFVAKST